LNQIVKRQVGDHGLNTRPAKDEENKIGIGCDLVEIAKVRCKVIHMISRIIVLKLNFHICVTYLFKALNTMFITQRVIKIGTR
jgi:hypothetical protein